MNALLVVALALCLLTANGCMNYLWRGENLLVSSEVALVTED